MKEHFVLLPELDLSGGNLPAPDSDAFGSHGSGMPVLATYASALVVRVEDVRPEQLKSVPSPWARPLLFEQTLFSESHPAHAAVVSEWRGLLGLIALHPQLGIRLEFEKVELPHPEEATKHSTMRLLAQMLPTNEWDRWSKLALILANKSVIGATSPRTLVYSSIRPAIPETLAFAENGHIKDPGPHYARLGDSETLQWLWRWVQGLLANLRQEGQALRACLGDLPQDGGPRSGPLLLELEDWSKELAAAIQSLGGTPTGTPYSGQPLTLRNCFPNGSSQYRVYGVLGSIQTSTLEGRGRAVDLITSDHEGIAGDPGRAGTLWIDGQPYSGPITLQLEARQVENGRFTSPTSKGQISSDQAVKVVDFSQYWASRLARIEDQSRENCFVLTVGDGSEDAQAYLYPFSEGILTLVSPEELGRWVTAVPTMEGGVAVRLEIPLRKERLVLRYERVFTSAEIIPDTTSPDFAMWPDFEAEDWSHYYYSIREKTRESGLQLAPIKSVSGPVGSEVSSDNDSWWLSEKPVRAWNVTVPGTRSAAGLLLVRPAQKAPNKAHDWLVSVDFGSTHTRAFYREEGQDNPPTEKLTILGSHCRILLGTGDAHSTEFFPIAPGRRWDELGSVAYARAGLAKDSQDLWLPVHGSISLGDRLLGPFQNLLIDLKWHKRGTAESHAFLGYLTQLCLMIKAEAYANGARISRIKTAVPSVFPQSLRGLHQSGWQRVEKRVKIMCEPARSESDALAAFMQDKMRAVVGTGNLVACDIGGSTSDISIWLKGDQPVSDSVQLAGDLISRVIRRSEIARTQVAIAAQRRGIIRGDLKWEDRLSALQFNGLLRECEKADGNSLGIARELNQGVASDGFRVLAHVAFLFSSLSYVMGLFTRMARVEEDPYNLRLAGRGAQFSIWLDAIMPEYSKEIPKKFFALGVGPGVGGVLVELSDMPKEEIGRGLLATPAGKASGPLMDRKTALLESGFTSKGKPLSFDGSLTIATLREIDMPSGKLALGPLASLREFLSEFVKNPMTKDSATALGISEAILSDEYRDQLMEWLFGSKSAYGKAGVAADADTSLLEPFIVTELKLLLEMGTKQLGLLFSRGE